MAKFGAKRDQHDARDFAKDYGLSSVPSAQHHPTVDLRKYVDYIYSQGSLNSCTANALCAAYRIDLKKQIETYRAGKYHNFEPSRLFLFYNSRKYEHTTKCNEGVSLRDAVKTVHKEGVCPESCWPYDESKFAEKPSKECFKGAKGNIVKKYERLKQDINQFRACLKEGSPFAFGFVVHGDFEIGVHLAGGVMKLPEETDPIIVGEHAVLAVGYDDTNRQIICLNSWGESWGDKGYFYMPYKYIVDEDLAFDFWKISFVSQNKK